MAIIGTDEVGRITLFNPGAQRPLDQLFSRFFRSSVAQKRAIPGSGLGLSISKAVVEKHGGTISVPSSSERGTTFRVRLPIVV